MARGLALALALVLIAPLAHADEYDAAMARAAAMKEKAIDSGDPASWLETYRLFEEADAIRSTKESKYELGAAAIKIRGDDLAVQAFEDAIALGLDGPAREKADAFITEMAPKIAHLNVSGPAGAEVMVGTRKRGKLPLSRALVVFSGTARVTITHEGKTTEKSVTAAGGATVSLDFNAKDPPPPPPPPKVDPLPPPPPIVETGRRGWTLIGVGGATTAIGVVGWIVAQRTIALTRDSLNETCAKRSGDQCAETYPEWVTYAKSDVDSIATWKAVRVGAIATTAVGSVLLGAGIVRLATSPSRSTAWVPRLSVGASGVFVGLDGAF